MSSRTRRPDAAILWVAAAWLAGCSPTLPPDAGQPPSRQSAAVSILWWHPEPPARSGTGARGPGEDPARWEQLAAYCLAQAPDVLILSDIPIEPAWRLLDARFSAPSGPYPEGVVSGNEGESTVHALWSARPIVDRRVRTGLAYRSGGRTHRLRNGILDVAVATASAGSLRLIAAGVKDKTFHPSGQSEMRRNESRLVGNHLADTVFGGPAASVVVFAALHDHPDSAPVRTLVNDGPIAWTDVRPADESDHAWTTHDPATDRYTRSHYLLVAPGIDGRVEAGLLDGRPCRDVSVTRPMWVRLAPADGG